MIVFKKANELQKYIGQQQSKGTLVGFAPTMGALHQGHSSLIEACQQIAGLTVCSIFVNPTQFNDPIDFQKYPIRIEEDIYMLERKGTDILFLPGLEEIYPEGTKKMEHYDLGYLETILEGYYRPGHFQGVCQVMHRLLDIVKPDHLFMGQKDYQQCLVVERLLQLMESTTVFHACPTLREPDGLAMSSRNIRLSEEERRNAVAIYNALSYLKKNLSPGDLSVLLQEAKKILTASEFKIEYVEITDSDSLKPVHSWNGQLKLTALIAAFQGEVRLIDNMILT